MSKRKIQESNILTVKNDNEDDFECLISSSEDEEPTKMQDVRIYNEEKLKD